MVRTRIQLDEKRFCWNVVPSWEQHFGLRFAHATTVGHVWAIVEQQLVVQLGGLVLGLTAAGATHRTFYHLRRMLMTQGIARHRDAKLVVGDVVSLARPPSPVAPLAASKFGSLAHAAYVHDCVRCPIVCHHSHRVEPSSQLRTGAGNGLVCRLSGRPA
jgi:hypothetical protein